MVQIGWKEVIILSKSLDGLGSRGPFLPIPTPPPEGPPINLEGLRGRALLRAVERARQQYPTSPVPPGFTSRIEFVEVEGLLQLPGEFAAALNESPEILDAVRRHGCSVVVA